MVIQIDNVDVLWQTKKTLQLNQSNYFHKLQMIDENLRRTVHVSEYFRIQPLKQHTQPHPAHLKTRRKKSCFQKPCWFWSTQSLEHHGTKVPWHGCHQKAKSYHDLTCRWILQRLHTTSLITLLNIIYVFFRQASCTATQFGPSRASWSSLYLGRSRIVTEVHEWKNPDLRSRICCPNAHSATMRRWNRSTGRKSTSKNSGIPRSCLSQVDI